MIKKTSVAVLLFVFSMNAHAEGGGLKKILPWNWGKQENSYAPAPQVEKIYPTEEDRSTNPSRSGSRSRISIPTNPKLQQAEAMVEQKAQQASNTRALSPEESDLKLPNFFGATGGPDLPTVRTSDGTVISQKFFNSLATREHESPEAIAQAMAAGVATHELVYDATFHGYKLSDLLGDNPDLSSFHDMAHTGLMVYLAEHKLTGGDPNRGYRPQFIPSFARFVLETYPLMLESGELLYPKDRAFQYIATGKTPLTRNDDPRYTVAFNEAQIAMTDTDGFLLGHNMYPIFKDATVDSEGKTYFSSDVWGEMAAYSKGFESFLNQKVLMAFPIQRFGDVYAAEPAYKEADTRRKIREDLFTLTPLAECFKLMARLKFKDARECFNHRKEEKMYRELVGAENYATLKDFKDAAIRGAIAGGVVTEISGAMDLGSGIAVGALANVLRTSYNRYLRKEDQFTQEQFDALMSFIKTYTFEPGPDGIIHPKMGKWKVLENGTIYRYRSESKVVGFKKVKVKVIEDGKEVEVDDRQPITAMRDIPIDLYGREQKTEVGFRINIDPNADVDSGSVRAYGHMVDIRRSKNRAARRTAHQLKQMSGEEEVDEKEVKDVQPKADSNPNPRPTAIEESSPETTRVGIPKVSQATLNSFRQKAPAGTENERVVVNTDEKISEKSPAPTMEVAVSTTNETKIPAEAKPEQTMLQENPLLPPLNPNPPRTMQELEQLQNSLPIPEPPKPQNSVPPKELNIET